MRNPRPPRSSSSRSSSDGCRPGRDLDGDGQIQFLSQEAGVAFDYEGDGILEQTAWVGSNDGLLVRDANGDGIVNDGREIIFGTGGQTDLEGLAARHDSNGDGQLTAEDAEYASFGVWQEWWLALGVLCVVVFRLAAAADSGWVRPPRVGVGSPGRSVT